MFEFYSFHERRILYWKKRFFFFGINSRKKAPNRIFRDSNLIPQLNYFSVFTQYIQISHGHNTPMADQQKYVWRWLNCNYHDLLKIQHAKRSQSLDQKCIHLVIRLEPKVDRKNQLIQNSTEQLKFSTFLKRNEHNRHPKSYWHRSKWKTTESTEQNICQARKAAEVE